MSEDSEVRYQPVAVRFARKIGLADSGCWQWCGAVSNHGYGSFRFGRKTVLPHRFSLLVFKNIDVPADKYVCHRCDNPLCVRPDHLFVGTSSDNANDRNAKRRYGAVTKPERQVRGERHPHAKLTAADVAGIRAASGPQTAIARRFGVTQATVSRIRSGQGWKEVQS